jgi:hypothetical protein
VDRQFHEGKIGAPLLMMRRVLSDDASIRVVFVSMGGVR